MSDKKAEKTAKPQRADAVKLLTEFLKKNGLVLIADENSVVTNVIKDLVYTVDKRPRIRVLYKDQLQTESNGKKEDEPIQVN